MTAALDINNPHRYDPWRFVAALRMLLADREDVLILPPVKGLTGVCRRCGWDSPALPLRFSAPSPAAREYVAVAKVRAAVLAGWDGRSGCWSTIPNVVAIHRSILAQGGRKGSKA